MRRETWVRWGICVTIVGGVFLATLLWGPDHSEVVRQLEEQYAVEQVEWRNHARFSPEVLVVDGRDISDECTVRGEWASLDNLRIECETDVGIGEVVN